MFKSGVVTDCSITRDERGIVTEITFTLKITDDEIEDVWRGRIYIDAAECAALPAEGSPERGAALRERVALYIHERHAVWYADKMPAPKTVETVDVSSMSTFSATELSGAVAARTELSSQETDRAE